MITIMKKQYIIPSLFIVKLDHEELLLDSSFIPIGGSGTTHAKERNIDFGSSDYFDPFSSQSQPE